MPFFLKRGGNNVPLEVQRWQYFLLKQNIPQEHIHSVALQKPCKKLLSASVCRGKRRRG